MATRSRNLPNQQQEEIIIDGDGTEVLENIADKYSQNKKIINIVVFGVLAAIIGFFAYLKLVKEPGETKALVAIKGAEQALAMDSLDRALNGDAVNAGFLKIIKNYSGTSAANLANYYAGSIYLKKGDFKNAIKYLEAFDGNGTVVENTANGMIGDAYAESGDLKKAITYYTKAANSDNDGIAPVYLNRLGLAYEATNQPAEAIKSYKKISEQFPTSMEAREIDKSLARLGQLD